MIWEVGTRTPLFHRCILLKGTWYLAGICHIEKSVTYYLCFVFSRCSQEPQIRLSFSLHWMASNGFLTKIVIADLHEAHRLYTEDSHGVFWVWWQVNKYIAMLRGENRTHFSLLPCSLHYLVSSFCFPLLLFDHPFFRCASPLLLLMLCCLRSTPSRCLFSSIAKKTSRILLLSKHHLPKFPTSQFLFSTI